MDEDELQTKIDQIYKVIKKLADKYSKKKVDWLMTISGKEFGLVESLIENFLSNIEQVKYSSKILMILQKMHEYVPDIVHEQYLESKLFPKAISEYIKVTKEEDMTPDAFLLLKEIFQESTFEEVLVDKDFIMSLMESLTIINKAEYFDAVWDILLVRFQRYCSDTVDPEEPINEETEYFLKLISEHKTGRMFIETIVHLLNRRGSEARRTMNCLTHIVLSKESSAIMFKGNKLLLVDIIDENLDKDMDDDDRQSMIGLMYYLLSAAKDESPPFYRDKTETIRDVCRKLNEDPDTLTEKSNEFIELILKEVETCETNFPEDDDED